MPSPKILDSLVQQRLRAWPQRPPGLGRRHGQIETWYRGRPSDFHSATHPFLKLPGCGRMKTIPDGLWLNFGGTYIEPFVDIFVIEACCSLSNLLDKRARFAPSTQSLLAVCPVNWLRAPSPVERGKLRWQTITQLKREPSIPFVLPVRDIRVMYGLTARNYGIMQGSAPASHEYYVPMESLTAEKSEQSPALHALMERACPTANFLSMAEAV